MSIDRTDCGRCGGSGQVTKMVAGRSGMVPCPDCDNVPAYAVPEDPPDDPHARLEEIDQRIRELGEEKQAWKELREDIGEATDRLEAVAGHDLVSDETEIKLRHVVDQIRMLNHHQEIGRGGHVHERKHRLSREKQEIQTLIDHLEGDDE